MSVRILNGDSQTRLEILDSSHVGECRRLAQRLAELNKFNPTSFGRVGIVATELATNLLRHAGSGEILIQLVSDGPTVDLELVAIDRGPGIPDIARSLEDGFSTAGTPGNGLGAVSRMSSTFDVHSSAGKGTVVLSRIPKLEALEMVVKPSQGQAVQFGAICVAMKGETECGDAWSIAVGSESIAILVADGLGHGPLAASAARAAIDAFRERPFDGPPDVIRRMHSALGNTRGAAGACALLCAKTSTIDYAGVGNISGFVVTSSRSHGMVSHNGTLGRQMWRIQKFVYDWPSSSYIIMHSDGLSARWSIADYAGLLCRHAAVVAAVLYRDHARGKDDATVLVARRQ